MVLVILMYYYYISIATTVSVIFSIMFTIEIKCYLVKKSRKLIGSLFQAYRTPTNKHHSPIHRISGDCMGTANELTALTNTLASAQLGVENTHVVFPQGL